jgi:FMN phosphatase YigB (HAD superfamily)
MLALQATLPEPIMIKVLMFDLGDTLVGADRQPFPHARDALAVIAQLKTRAGKPLRSCLVSDFDLAAPPATPARVAAIFARYLTLLDATGLRTFFEPVQKRVTLSTHASAMKPDAAVFEKALRRLGVRATLAECLLVTDNKAHVRAVCQHLHMHALQFQPPGATGGDFDDWADAPALIAHEVAPDHADNLHAVVKAHLAAQGVDLVAAKAVNAGGAVQAAGRVWCPVPVPGCADLQGLQVAMPVASHIARGPRGKLASAPVVAPSADDLAEAGAFVQSLAHHGQIGGRAAGTEVLRPTHRIETDAGGVRRLVRSRFSAV